MTALALKWFYLLSTIVEKQRHWIFNTYLRGVLFEDMPWVIKEWVASIGDKLSVWPLVVSFSSGFSSNDLRFTLCLGFQPVQFVLKLSFLYEFNQTNYPTNCLLKVHFIFRYIRIICILNNIFIQSFFILLYMLYEWNLFFIIYWMGFIKYSPI